jgi:regulator of protease activity HflC (stomatin/prohibitin superfamily)
MARNSGTPSVSGRAAARIGTLSLIGFIAIVLLGVVFSAWRTVDPGYVGIVFDKASRKVTATLDPGWVFINPFTQSITRYPVGLRTLVMVRADQEGVTQGDDSVKVGSKEGQTMFADVSVQYSVNRETAARLYEVWAGQPIEYIEENLVRQVTRSALNDIASQYGWEEIYGAKRIEYVQRVSENIAGRFKAKFVNFESLNLRGWFLPESIQKALDAKITAQQAAQQQSFELEQAKVRAEQDKVAAEGQANALRAQAQGEADATKIRAQAQAEANRALSQSLTPDLIRYQQLQRWDGKLPIFSGGSATPLIDATSIISDTGR